MIYRAIATYNFYMFNHVHDNNDDGNDFGFAVLTKSVSLHVFIRAESCETGTGFVDRLHSRCCVFALCR